MPRPSVPAGTKEKLAEARVNWPASPPALGVRMLGKVNFGAGASAQSPRVTSTNGALQPLPLFLPALLNGIALGKCFKAILDGSECLKRCLKYIKLR